MGKKAADAENPVQEESCTDKPQKNSASGNEQAKEETPQNAFRASEKQSGGEQTPAGDQTEIPYGYAPNGEEFTGMPEYGFQQQPYGYMPPPPPPPYGYGYMPPQPPYGYMPQMPYGYMPPPPPPYGYMPQQPYGYMPQMPHEAHHGNHQEHHGDDPFGMLFGKFGDMIKENPHLSAVGKIADASGSDFVKGMLIGAGVAMLFSNDSIKDSLMSIFSKTLGGMAEDAEETE
ncbi:hypothetical protein EP073_05640 [Geovibrio thiophilus]|uniref:Uncharacterized protein n=1 Tax=Geovibrio thiophilus TaxID=139438 RepID=A0A410JXM1_9BACT|nr:hypothetical protein [Geovibrio thiophilus]QAR32904.1 hypothetical protein EP073_05640 [Geovibrio thiophilus]